MLFSRRIIVFLLALALGVLGGMVSAAETREELVQELAHVDHALSSPDSVDPQDPAALPPPEHLPVPLHARSPASTARPPSLARLSPPQRPKPV